MPNYFLNNAFSGHHAKRLTYNCNNVKHWIFCYFNLTNFNYHYFSKNFHIPGIYKKIYGDAYQSAKLDINNGKYTYYDDNNNLLYMSNCDMIDLNDNNFPDIVHINNPIIENGNFGEDIMSISKPIKRELLSNGIMGITEGTAYNNGKFNNPLYIGKYTARHSYTYNTLNNNPFIITSVIYENNYSFNNGRNSSATYILEIPGGFNILNAINNK